MIRILKNNYLVIAIFILALILRLRFSTSYAHLDLITQTDWGKQANVIGSLKNFYTWEQWGGSYPNHPPLISWLYYILYPLHSNLMMFLSNLGNFIALHRLAPTKFLWLFDFAIWFGTVKYDTYSTLAGIIFLLKQFMIIADLAIGLTIYYLSKKNITYTLIYLFLPFSWYLSSSWGQSDQLSFIFLLTSIIFITSKRFSPISPLLFAIAANLKPNCLLLLPIYLVYWYRQKQTFKNLLIGGIIATIFSLWTVSWFTNENVLIYTFTVLPGKLNTGGGLTNYNAFNFWYIFHPFSNNGSRPDTITYLFLSAKIWGLILSFVTIIISLRIKNIFSAMFIAGFGSWLFMTGMHERYSFLAILPVLLLSISHPKYLKYFLILSTIFTLNLFIAYWPWLNLGFMKSFQSNSFFVSRLLSAANVIIYFRLTRLFLKRKHLKSKSMQIKTIVPVKESDFSNSITLLNSIFSKYPNAQDYNSKFAFEKTLSHDPLIVEVTENNQLIAFALCYQRYENYYHIWDLGVEESYRGQGIASKIYDIIENYAREKKYVGISLNTFNRFKENIRLLLKRGYQISGLETEGEFSKDPKINLKLIF